MVELALFQQSHLLVVVKVVVMEVVIRQHKLEDLEEEVNLFLPHLILVVMEIHLRFLHHKVVMEEVVLVEVLNYSCSKSRSFIWWWS